jgi:hypothetical protein
LISNKSNAGLVFRSGEYTLLELAVDFADSNTGLVGYGGLPFDAAPEAALEVDTGGATGFLVTIVAVGSNRQ